MVATLVAETRDTAQWTGIRTLSERVLNAMRAVPRHQFVPPDLEPLAYADGPLAIGHGQTISQPFIVALMTELLQPGPDQVVLEVGTGSGYQAAVLSHLVKQVYSMEIVPPLAEAAARRLRALAYDNVEVRCGDGYLGWPEHAPYDGVMVTAASPTVPQPLVEQLRPGGRLVVPVGEPHGSQMLTMVEKDKEGGIRQRDVLPVVFVPLTRHS
ncbi:MAG TPA: protein-L-isoaspartate(D-aspartate) O-methyltransferase [Gammaproteobacteria bacterium]|nr:protein-L-isoaspartate(D-aspartate) O-methyltransferase [Gammaproteobacteria bacterium]